VTPQHKGTLKQESWDFSKITGAFLATSNQKRGRSYRTSTKRATAADLRACLLWELGRELPNAASCPGLRDTASKEFTRYFTGGTLAKVAVDMATHGDFDSPWQLPPPVPGETAGTLEKPTQRELLLEARDAFRSSVNPPAFAVHKIEDSFSVDVLYSRLRAPFLDVAGKPLKTNPPSYPGWVVLEVSPSTWTNFPRDAVEAQFRQFLASCNWTPSGVPHKWQKKGVKDRSYCTHLLGLGLLRLVAHFGPQKAISYFKSHYKGNPKVAGDNDWEDWRKKCQKTMKLWHKIFPGALPKFYSALPEVLKT
jgi:hypothetical protein